MTSNASLGTMATPRVEVSVRQWLTKDRVREREEERGIRSWKGVAVTV